MSCATSSASPSTPPSNASAGTTTSRCRSCDEVARMPSESQVGSTVMPSVSAGIRNCDTSDGSAALRAATRYPSAWPAPEQNVLAPLMRKPVPSAEYTVDSWDSREPTPRSLIATAYHDPCAAAASNRSRAVRKLSGTPSASMSASGMPASAPVTDACMLNTRAVAPLPRASSWATIAYSANPAPSPPSRVGTIRPNSPASRRSAKSSPGKSPAMSYPLARAAKRGTSRRAVPPTSLMPKPRSARPRHEAPPHRASRFARYARSCRRPDRLVEDRRRPGRHHRHRALPGHQPAQQTQDLRAEAAGAQRHAVPGALGGQLLRVDEQVRVVDPRRRAARHPLSHGDRHEPAQRRIGQGVEHQQPAWAQDATHLGHGGTQVGDVLQELTGAHHVGAAVRQRQPGHVGPDRDHPVVTGLRERRGGQIDADVAVALSGKVRRKQPSPAAEVGEDGAGAGRGRDQAGAGLGDPRQHRELAARAPPLRRQVVVLSYVVPGPNGRPHARQPYTKRYTPATLAGCGRPSRCSERATRSRRRR